MQEIWYSHRNRTSRQTSQLGTGAFDRRGRDVPELRPPPGGFQLSENPRALFSDLQEMLHFGGLARHRSHVTTMDDHRTCLGDRPLAANQIDLHDTSVRKADHPEQLQCAGSVLHHGQKPRPRASKGTAAPQPQQQGPPAARLAALPPS